MLDRILQVIFYINTVFIFALLIFGIDPTFFMDVFGKIFHIYGYLHTQLVKLWQKIMGWTRS
jgi:hypothetical protein